MTDIKDLLAQQEALLKQIEEIRSSKRSEAVADALALINEYKLTPADLFPNVAVASASGKTTKERGKVAAKYRDPDTGKEWTGRGVTPKWIADSGKDKSAFLIA